MQTASGCFILQPSDTDSMIEPYCMARRGIVWKPHGDISRQSATRHLLRPANPATWLLQRAKGTRVGVCYAHMNELRAHGSIAFCDGVDDESSRDGLGAATGRAEMNARKGSSWPCGETQQARGRVCWSTPDGFARVDDVRCRVSPGRARAMHCVALRCMEEAAAADPSPRLPALAIWTQVGNLRSKRFGSGRACAALRRGLRDVQCVYAVEGEEADCGACVHSSGGRACVLRYGLSDYIT
ncbi:hypothetical protein PYCCODRAFT_654651 [Trametes coccinea BRFM310]|uniref:Uncharacterized protein n=1 Tax=Trametes coccinea (strain BRFM310) TaxID=1353009 RepID=A0A1Y2IHQ4_TRAC3|nr:hypothetical protein PYCCODRAFT_654651 [Trametes coccinea BRFM310]